MYIYIDNLDFGANTHLYGVQICIVHMYVHNCGYMLCVLSWFCQKLTHMAVHDWLKVARVVPWGTELRGQGGE